MHHYNATMRVVICPTMKFFKNPVLSSYRLRLITKLLALKKIVINFESQECITRHNDLLFMILNAIYPTPRLSPT